MFITILYEEDIKKAFLEAFNNIMKNKEEIQSSYEVIIEALGDNAKQYKEEEKHNKIYGGD